MTISRNGFTLIELIVVIVIIAVLAVVAAPRFLDLNSDARESMLKGVAAEFQQGVNFANQRWAIEGRSGSAQVDLPGYADGTLDINDVGFPIGTEKRPALAAPYNIGLGNQGCVDLFETLLDTSLTATTSINQVEQNDFYTRRQSAFVPEAGGDAQSQCYYIYTKSGFSQDPTDASYVIWYDSRTGDVSFVNNGN